MACLGSFLFGALVGSLFAAKRISERATVALRNPPALASDMLRDVRDDLHLSDAQATEIRQILETHLGNVARTVRHEHDLMIREMEGPLTPEQRARHRAIAAERQARLFGEGTGGSPAQ